MKFAFLNPLACGQAARADLGCRTKRRLQALAGAIVIVGGLPSLAAGAALHVDQNNAQCTDAGSGTQARPFCKIGAAAARVAAGDRVLVRSGTYNEAVVVRTSGTASAPIVFDAVGAVVVTGQARGFDLSGRSWINLSGFTISNTTIGGIRALVSDNLKISNNQVFNAGGIGIEVRDCSNVTIADNDIQDSVAAGILVKFCNNVTVAGNHVSGAGQPVLGLIRNGITINGSALSEVSDNVTEGNSDHGIYVTNGSTSIYVKGNTTRRNARQYARAAAGMELRGSSDNTVEGNITYENEDSGINVRSGSDRNLVVNNLSYNNGDHGIDYLGVSEGSIIGNTVYGNLEHGLEIEGGSVGLTVANNIAVGNGLTTGAANIRTSANAVEGTVPDSNVVFMSAPGVMYTWGDVNYASLDALRAANPALEVHGVEADPRFVAPGSGDFHLRAGSPAIDSAKSGLKGAALAVDLEGKSRFDDPATPNTGAGPQRLYDDRGAFEFQSATPSNSPPQIASGPTATPNPLFSNETADLAVSATDADNDPLSYDWTVRPGGGTIQGNGPNVTYVPPPVTASATFAVSVQVSDGRGGTDIATVDVTVDPVAPLNAQPRITRGPISTRNPVASDQTAELSVAAADVNNDPLTYAWSVPPGGGSTSGTGADVTYMPPAVNAPRVFTIGVEVRDGQGGTNIGTLDLTVTPAPVGTVSSFRPVADAWVYQSTPNRNRGGAKKLKVDKRAVATTFLRFVVTGITAPVQSAWIELEVTEAGSQGGTIRSVPDNTWREFKVTYNNQPAVGGPALDSTGAVIAGTIIQLDVTPAISQNGTYSFAIVGDGFDRWAASSREGSANSPMLFITSGQTP